MSSSFELSHEVQRVFSKKVEGVIILEAFPLCHHNPDTVIGRTISL